LLPIKIKKEEALPGDLIFYKAEFYDK